MFIIFEKYEFKRFYSFNLAISQISHPTLYPAPVTTHQKYPKALNRYHHRIENRHTLIYLAIPSI